MPDTPSHDDQPEAQPPVEQLLLDRIDEHVKVLGQGLDHLATLVAQLHPERARSCATAVVLARTGIDEVRLRAHARPLDEPES